MAEHVPTSEAVPEHQDRGLLGLFGKKKEEQELGMQAPAIHSQLQTQAAHLYPTNPPHASAVDQQNGQGYGHGHEGQYTAAGEADKKQQHTGLIGKLHRTHSSSSSSVSISLLLSTVFCMISFVPWLVDNVLSTVFCMISFVPWLIDNVAVNIYI